MRLEIRDFLADENGAVTVDWVVLTAAVVIMVTLLFTILTRAIFSESGMAIVDLMNQRPY